MTIRDFIKKEYEKWYEYHEYRYSIGLFPESYLGDVFQRHGGGMPQFYLYYKNDLQRIDSYLLNKYGSIAIKDKFLNWLNVNDPEDFENYGVFMDDAYNFVFSGFIAENYDNLEKMFTSLTIDYDVFENFNTTRKITETHGKQTITDTIDDRKTTVNNGEVTNTDTIGNSQDTISYGENTTTTTKDKTSVTMSHSASTDTETNDSFVDETINYKNGYDNGIEQDSKTTLTHKNTDGGDVKKMTVNGAYDETTVTSGTGANNKIVDSVVDSSHTDTTTHGSHTDTHKISEHTTTTNIDGYIDTHEEDSYINETIETFKGNQGVSITNQVLVKNEIDLRVLYQFYDIMFNMWLPYISKGVWE